MDTLPLKGSREAAAEGNNYITAYQTVMKKVRNTRVSASMIFDTGSSELHTKYVLIHKLFGTFEGRKWLCKSVYVGV